jgi:uncharacterized protein with GYD domain
MPFFVLMTKASPELLQDPRGRKRAGDAWKQEVELKCPGVRWIAHYALLGRYDFMDIYEAPDLETAHKVSYISLRSGASDAESWHALPYDKYLELAETSES